MQKENRRGDFPRLAASAAVALLFVLMLPAQALSNLGVVQRLAVLTHLPVLAWKLVVVGLAFGLVFLAVLWLWGRLHAVQPSPQARSQPKRAGLLRGLGYALPCLIAWGTYLYAYWPGILTSDSFDQWDQAHNLIRLNDWHPVGHTLLIFLLTRIWDSPAMIAMVQVAAMAIAWGAAMRFFESHGISPKILFPLAFITALAPNNGIMLVTLWKDIPYTIVNFILVFQLGLIVYSRGDWLERTSHKVLLGIVLGAADLLRHNGLVVILLTLAVLFFCYARRWRALAMATAVALVLVLVIQNGIGFGLFKAKPNNPAVAYVVPIQHISAVVHYGGQPTVKEQAVLERIAPILDWNKAYLRYSGENMSKPWGYLKDPLVLDKITQNRSDLLSVFISLAMRYPRAVIRSELDLTTVIWRITPPPDNEYRDYRYLFDLTSVERAGMPVRALFIQANQNSTLKTFLDRILTDSTGNNLTDIFLWEGGLYLFLTLAFGLIGFIEKGWRFLILLAPAAANAISLALAMPGENFRFVFPIVMPTVLIILFAISGETEEAPSQDQA